MITQLFEPLREWVNKTRRSKGSKKLSESIVSESARVSWRGGRLSKTVSSEINALSERFSSSCSDRSLDASWLYIKQMTAPPLA